MLTHRKQWLLIIPALIVAGVLAYVAWKRPPAEQVPPPGSSTTSTPTSTVDVTAGWNTYVWGDLLFKYPRNWRVVEETYRTPAQQASGERGEVIGLSIVNPAEPDATIMVGGRQMDCATWRAVNMGRPGTEAPCYTFYDAPVYTALSVSGGEELGRVYDALIQSIRYSRAGVDFSVESPRAGEAVQRGSQYTVRWATTPGLSVGTVDIFLHATDSPDPRILTVDNVPNVSSYPLQTPAALSTQGPYLIEVSQCVPIPGSQGDCRLRTGWSDPFYVR